MERSYRIHIQPGDILTDASFSEFWVAESWARGYARRTRTPTKIKIVNHLDRVSACYLGDGEGHVRSASDEIGEAFAR